ncbi:flagellar basal body-associated protein FliL [Pseudidiomarina sp. CB1]|uniref:flagellar basal body-associated protein FliL n=1 Tax=Pseudidiomarina sp. CB1 TaxID=2972484 RepID=UPI002163AB62|nr:flagellar basal body-associated protein FliL [Pseudidiomarina sp. CB1]
MATKKEQAAQQAKSSSKLLYVLVFFMMILVALNTWLLWDTRSIAAQAAAGNGQPVEQESADPVFLSISPFTVNLASDQFGPRLLYAGLTLELPSDKVKETLSKNMPQVRNRLLVLLSGQRAEKIAQSEGKKTLAQSIASTLSQPYNGDEPIEINDVLFTEFIVQ